MCKGSRWLDQIVPRVHFQAEDQQRQNKGGNAICGASDPCGDWAQAIH